VQVPQRKLTAKYEVSSIDILQDRVESRGIVVHDIERRDS
jgi:hypothetical protein